MSIKNTHTDIPKKVATHDDLDYYYLRKLGIQYIEELGGGLWTDFNAHDPGITMMEMLCYAITDLGTRIDMPINDLLASQNKDEQLANQFYRASDIFPTKPVTKEDYRKLFINIEGVRNCWLTIAEKTVYVDCKNDVLSYDASNFETIPNGFKREYNFKGLYNILVDFEGLDESLTDDEREIEINRISNDIRVEYHKNRNLCEDIIYISEIGKQPISVCASIEVFPESDEELIHAKVLRAINEYFSTTLHFYSIKEMLGKGYTSDEIFEGPLLDKGFIDPKELKEAELRSEVRLSDIMKIIMNIEGVKLIKDISIGHCDSNEDLLNKWLICIKENKKPFLCDKSTFSYSKGVLPLNINQFQVAVYLKELEDAAILENVILDDEKDLEFPQSTFRSPGGYTTIQNDFPETYGIGQSGLAARATEIRKSQAKQLKGYLLFFDKILAGYFQHLSKVGQLLSVNGNLNKTYFTQAVEGLKDFGELVSGYPSDDDAITDLLFDKQDNNIERRNKVLDHLLARFSEKFGEYAFLMKTLYGNASSEIVLANKKAFLKDYRAIGLERGCAFNYFKQGEENLWDTDNISGVQKRIARLLGVKNYNRRVLSSSFVDVRSFVNTDSKTVFKWRIKDENTAEILSSPEEFNTLSSIHKELYLAVLLIIQTSEEGFETLFKELKQQGSTLLNNTIIGNIRILVSDSGIYSFDIVDLSKSVDVLGYSIARHPKTFNTVSDLEAGILSVISFMKFRFTEEGVFLVEHILLRPDITQDSATPFLPICTDNCEDECGIDPYSYRVSIIMPGYTYRFSNPDFRNYMEMIIKEELPAHILPKICWVGHRENDLDNIKEQKLQQLENEKNSFLKEVDEQILTLQNTEPPLEGEAAQITALEVQRVEIKHVFEERKSAYLDSVKDKMNDLAEFEEKYKAFLLAKTALDHEQPDELEALMAAMGNLNTIYPVGRLLDCDDESDDMEGKIILGQTNIGTL
ncbi:hypothetical protein [Mariniflexile sp. AS56]|uniref:hypothetical protein n=1 Tax=Mariniflexile sp. AS56 TaxID=3063957 RepID=UPI0026F142A5|nr:hypothetical protein [Mariniflexile sp. AS56]MDO7174059.1 hypothetical protein [Mariniflexile sp. AS56]